MLHVIDVASHQWDLIKNKSPLITGADCMIVKISEGVNYRNPYAFDTLKLARTYNMGIGVYHYARAEKNNPEAEALYFLETINSLRLEKPCVLALDYEGAAFDNKNMDLWARTFLDRVYAETKIRPLLYVQADMIRRFPSVKDGNYGLWLAWWDTMKAPAHDPWPFWAIWQYHVIKTRSYGLDLNLFNGDALAWNKYGGG